MVKCFILVCVYKSRCRVFFASTVALGLFGVYVVLEAFCIPGFKFSLLKVNTSTAHTHKVLQAPSPQVIASAILTSQATDVSTPFLFAQYRILKSTTTTTCANILKKYCKVSWISIGDPHLTTQCLILIGCLLDGVVKYICKTMSMLYMLCYKNS